MPGARVLVVDDNVDLAENLAELFEDDGDVRVSNTARQAIETARAWPFDLAVVDVRLPDMTGVDLVPQLRALSPGGEVLLMTGNASLDTAIEAVRQGVFAYVQKPFAPDDMLALGRRALSQVELRRERERLAGELGRSERLHRGVVDTVESLIIGLDRDATIRVWSRCASEVTGWPAEEALGGNFLDGVVVEDERANFEAVLAKAWVGERKGEFQSSVRVRSGEGDHHRVIRWNLKPLEAREGLGGEDATLDLLLVVGIDVTERLDLEKRAADAEAMASLATLTAGLAHEIRNPLNAAILQLELLGRIGGKLTEERARQRIGNSVKLVQSEIKRLSRLLEEFLGLARPRSFDLYPLELRRLVHDVVTMQRPVAEAAGVRLKSRIGASGPRVMGDRAKLTQVLVNLVVNSIDALRGADGGAVEIDASLADDGRVVVEVADNGPGIADTMESEVFRPFFSTKEAGTGLGLTIVKKIIDLHGGAIELLPRSGGGTVARLTLKSGR